MDGMRWFAAAVLAAFAVAWGSPAAEAQYDGTTLSYPDRMLAPGDDLWGAPQPVTWNDHVPPAEDGSVAGLEGRIGELEAALAQMRRSEDEARRRAAGRPSVSVGGRVHLDWALFSQDAASRAAFGDQRDAVGFRRTRLGAMGQAFHVFNYRVEMDFAATDTGTNEDGSTFITQSTAFRDVYLGVSEMKKVKKTVWEVECEEVCLPWPLGPCHCCPGEFVACGRARGVLKLVKKEREVEVPSYRTETRWLCAACCTPQARSGAVGAAPPAPKPMPANNTDVPGPLLPPVLTSLPTASPR